MGYCDKKFGFRAYCTRLGFLIFSGLFYATLAQAGGNSDSAFLDTYALSQREKCEIYMSGLIRAEADNKVKCQDVNIFRPKRTLQSDGLSGVNKITLSSKADTDWPLVDLSLTTEFESGTHIVKSFIINDYNYNLSEYLLGGAKNFKTIDIGHIGDTIIIQLKNKTITQILISPKYCPEGDVDYSVSQSFSWFPPFKGESFSKTFFNSPECI